MFDNPRPPFSGVQHPQSRIISQPGATIEVTITPIPANVLCAIAQNLAAAEDAKPSPLDDQK